MLRSVGAVILYSRTLKLASQGATWLAKAMLMRFVVDQVDFLSITSLPTFPQRSFKQLATIPSKAATKRLPPVGY